MSDTEALLLLIGVPLLVTALIYALAWRGGPAAEKRYRPGRPYEFATVWFLANHRVGPATATPAVQPPRPRPALPAGRDRMDEAAAEELSRGAVGGASDRW